jgi:hypothetical protein
MKKREQLITNLYFKFYKKYNDLPNEETFDIINGELGDKLNRQIWYPVRGELFDQLYCHTIKKEAK